MDCLYLHRIFKRNTDVSSSIFSFLWNGFLGLDVSALVCGTIALVINSSAYIAEIVRAGINLFDKEQTEAQCLGLNYSKTMRYIILPQAIKNILPR